MTTSDLSRPSRITRRRFIETVGAGAVGLSMPLGLTVGCAPNACLSQRRRPSMDWGVASGDVSGNSAIIWSRTDRTAIMMVEYAATETFRNATRVVGPVASNDSGYTARVDLRDLPHGQQVFYRVAFQRPDDRRAISPWVVGTLRTASIEPRPITFAFSGDTAGQGFGINTQWGGMRLYETVRRNNPDFFIHSGDNIYADGPIESTVTLDDGTIWRNVVTQAKSKVAETLEEYRGNFEYNLLDHNVRRFNAQVPVLAQWDDHEVVNNWYPGEVLDDARYRVKDVSLLATRARRAFFEYMPIRTAADHPSRIFRHFHFGPLLDVLMLDMRSYRAPNGANDQPSPGPDTRFLGDDQIAWFKQRLLESKATWKVIASDMPVGLLVPDGSSAFENASNHDGPPRGREFELAGLLQFIKRRAIKNVVWVTADVHYAAAHYYDPARAEFQAFDPFWEFVAGPMHAGTYPPKALDNTFGPQVRFNSVPADLKRKRPPSEGQQFFGLARIDPDSRVMTVSVRDLTDRNLYHVDLKPK